MQEIYDKIARNKAKLEELLKIPQNANIINKWLKTELAYTSNAIEGNTLTRRETALVIEEEITSSPKPINDYLEARNHAKAYEYILELAEKNVLPTESIILNLHKLILSGIDDLNAGFYRAVRVRISGSQTILPNPLKVPELMQNFAKWLLTSQDNPIHKAIETHYRLVSIHPFIDGNGRTARLLMNLILIENGFAPIIIRPIDRRRYLSSLESYQLSNNCDSYYKFMLNALNRSLKMLIDLVDTQKPEVHDKLMTISKFAKLVGVPVSTIRYWIEIGKVKPISYTPAGYALFSAEQKDCSQKD